MLSKGLVLLIKEVLEIFAKKPKFGVFAKTLGFSACHAENGFSKLESRVYRRGRDAGNAAQAY
ncbi:hypothetical protein CW705_05150 [Candidatus Bathyarchaeota archaeon]|nr:MAG: hypothetical protein CW705_05150 [Candidatus Bathyarchaeota archaeon]